MKTSARMLAVSCAALAFSVQSGIVIAAEIKVLCAGGFQAVMDDLAPKFEAASRHKLILGFAPAEVTVKQIQGGEAADLVILPRDGIDTLVNEGKALGTTVSPLARVGISVAVPQGTRKPDISSPDALKRSLLAAKSVAYLDPAAGNANGILIAKMLDQMGIAKELKGKTILPATAKEMESLIAAGKAEIALNQTALLMTLTGIDIVGPVPGSLYPPLVFTGVTMKSARDTEATKALIGFLRNPESAKVIKSKGMEPAK